MNKSISFTGHRTVSNPAETRQNVAKVSFELINKGTTRFLSGGCWGFDNLAAEEIINLRKTIPEIELTVILPCSFDIFTQKWGMNEKKQLSNIMVKANEIVVLQDYYSKDCYKRRNEYLINNSRYCVCYYNVNDFRSGTGQTIRFAERRGLNIINVFNAV